MKNIIKLKVLIVSFCLMLTACGSGPEDGFGDRDSPVVSNGITVRVSVDADGSEGNNRSNSSSISSDGRYVAFVSSATNLVSGGQNSLDHIYLHDRDFDNDGIFDENEAGAISTIRVSEEPDGTPGDGISSSPSISSNGNFIAFESRATNLIDSDIDNVLKHVFVFNRTSGTMIRISEELDGTPGDGNSIAPSISDDGKVVAFESRATNLVADDNKNVSDIFVHDRTSIPGTTTRVSVDSLGSEADNGSFAPSISDDGNFVAFESIATNLVDNDNKNVSDVFIHNRISTPGTTTRVSVDSSGSEADNGSFAPSISDDGNFVAFESIATNLVPNDNKGVKDIFVNKP
jgi:Tol biopolymer transport system component